MDPNAALTEVLDLLSDRAYDAAKERFDDLQVWVMRGGFPPADERWLETVLRKAPLSWRFGWE